jgi:hypothetical protein
VHVPPNCQAVHLAWNDRPESYENCNKLGYGSVAEMSAVLKHRAAAVMLEE